MANPAAIRTGLAAAIRTAVPDAQVSEYMLASPTPPAFDIDLDPEGINYDQTGVRGIDEWWWLIRGFIVIGSDIGSQKRRDEWLVSQGLLSVKAALETNRTLSGACADLHVTNAVPRVYTDPTGSNRILLGAEWRVRMLAH